MHLPISLWHCDHAEPSYFCYIDPCLLHDLSHPWRPAAVPRPWVEKQRDHARVKQLQQQQAAVPSRCQPGTARARSTSQREPPRTTAGGIGAFSTQTSSAAAGSTAIANLERASGSGGGQWQQAGDRRGERCGWGAW